MVDSTVHARILRRGGIMKPTKLRISLSVNMIASCIATAILLATVPAALVAKSTTWTHGSEMNSLWSDPENWSDGVPGTSDDVYFSAIGGSSTLDIPFLMLDRLDMTGYTGTLDARGATLQIMTDFTMCGLANFENSVISIAGGLVVTGIMDIGDANIITGGDLVVSGELYDAAGGTIDVDGDVAGSPGAVLTMGSCRLTLWGNGDFSDFSEVGWGYGGLLILKGGPGTRQIVFGASTVQLPDVSLQRSSATDVTTIEAPAPLTFGGMLAVASGALELVADDVRFLSTISVSGELRYAASGGTLRFAAGPMGRVDVAGTGTFRITGDPFARVHLWQDGVPGGPQWILGYDETSTLAIENVEVQDGDAQGSSPAIATDSADKGNNTNWDFGGPRTTKWIGGSPWSTNWSDPLNWDLGSPRNLDDVVFDAVNGPSTMDIAALTLSSLDMSGFQGELTFAHGLSVEADMETAGSVSLEANVLTVLGSLTVDGTMDAEGATIDIGGGLNLGGVCDWTPGTSVNVAGSVEASGGAILNMGSSFLRVGGDLLLAAPSALSLCDIGDLVCAGASPVQLVSFPALPGGVMLRDVTIERAAADVVTRFSRPAEPLVLQGVLDIVTGVFQLAEGDLLVTRATIIHADGELVVDAGAGGASFEGPVSVRGALRCTGAGGRMSFAAGPACAVDVTNGGVFEAVGTPAERIHLEQDGIAGDDRWILLHDGTTTLHVDDVELQDGDAEGPALAAATNSVDAGNNANWYFGTVSGDDTPAAQLSLEAAPNPFNPVTTLRYALPLAGNVSIRIYDVTGSLVRSLVSGHRAAGRYEATWDGRNDAGGRAGSGAYFCRIESNGEAKVRKLLLMR
jgi:hypothetical protein